MKEKSIVMVGRKSPLNSAFAVFEHFKDWVQLRAHKVLPDNAYFVVVILEHKNKADIAPNLFVQGYRPHSSGSQLSVEKRRYGAFVPEGEETQFSDDVPFLQVQLYQIRGKNEVELILSSGDSRQKDRIEKLIERICQEHNYAKFGGVGLYSYHCPCSAGYFLENRVYRVWAVIIGESKDFSLEKKILVLDYYTGIPAVVAYDDEMFRKISSEEI